MDLQSKYKEIYESLRVGGLPERESRIITSSLNKIITDELVTKDDLQNSKQHIIKWGLLAVVIVLLIVEVTLFKLF